MQFDEKLYEIPRFKQHGPAATPPPTTLELARAAGRAWAEGTARADLSGPWSGEPAAARLLLGDASDELAKACNDAARERWDELLREAEARRAKEAAERQQRLLARATDAVERLHALAGRLEPLTPEGRRRRREQAARCVYTCDDGLGSRGEVLTSVRVAAMVGGVRSGFSARVGHRRPPAAVREDVATWRRFLMRLVDPDATDAEIDEHVRALDGAVVEGPDDRPTVRLLLPDGGHRDVDPEKRCWLAALRTDTPEKLAASGHPGRPVRRWRRRQRVYVWLDGSWVRVKVESSRAEADRLRAELRELRRGR